MQRDARQLKVLMLFAMPVVSVVLFSSFVPDASAWLQLGVGGAFALVCFGLYTKQQNQIVRNLAEQVRLLEALFGSNEISPGATAIQPHPLSVEVDGLKTVSSNLAKRIQSLLDSETALKRNLSLFQSILMTMSEGVLFIDSADQILFCNQSAGKLIGRSSGELHQRDFWEIVRLPELEEKLKTTLHEKLEFRQEIQIQRTRRSVEMSAVQLEAGSDAGKVIVLHDVTSIRQLERMRAEFVSNVSHELKTPLTAIQACTDTLLDGGLEDTEHSRRFVERIQEQSERLQRLIQDMLRLAKIESQADLFDLQRIDVQASLRSCFEARLPVAHARSVELTFQSPEVHCPDVLADHEGLRTIFDNLISNALSYTSENGHVDVRCWCEDSSVIVEVEDDGIGISKEHRDRIFERFFRVDQARSRGMGGTGLGLAIVKHSVHQFGGRIELESEMGRGSTFRIFFPTAEEPVQNVQPV